MHDSMLTVHVGRLPSHVRLPPCDAGLLGAIVLDAHPSDGRLIRYQLDLRTGGLSVDPGR